MTDTISKFEETNKNDGDPGTLTENHVAIVFANTKQFYDLHHRLFQESHDYDHALRVYCHVGCAIESINGDDRYYVQQETKSIEQEQQQQQQQQQRRQRIPTTTAMEIEIAALLHDVDDSKYFQRDNDDPYRNAKSILRQSKVPESHWESILYMIDLVSCSKNGNSVPLKIVESGQYYLLIPRWADRIEAVGPRGVWRCYKYNQEHNLPLCIDGVSPRPQTVEEVWAVAYSNDLDNVDDMDGQKISKLTRLEQYINRDGTSSDMISHYYDKLLHISCPPSDIVRNPYLEERLQDSSKPLIEVCLRYGKSGKVDTVHIESLQDHS